MQPKPVELPLAEEVVGLHGLAATGGAVVVDQHCPGRRMSQEGIGAAAPVGQQARSRVDAGRDFDLTTYFGAALSSSAQKG
jgi:hypothetical protein